MVSKQAVYNFDHVPERPPLYQHLLLVGQQTAVTLSPTIRQLNLPLYITSVESGQAALRLLHHIQVDILITEQVIPDMTGLQLIQTIQQNDFDHIFTVLLVADDVYARVLSLNSRFTIDMYLNSQQPLLNLPLLRQALNGRSHPIGSNVPDSQPSTNTLKTREH